LQATTTMPGDTTALRAQLYMYGTGDFNFDGGSLGAPQTAEAVYPPVATASPSVSGNATVGSTLTCSTGSWTNEPTSFVYSWQRDGNPIASASGPTYTITQADVGHYLNCNVTATDDAGSGTAASSNVGPITSTGSPGGSSGSQGGALGARYTRSAGGCYVPSLRHKTLRQAESVLRRAKCRLGKVKRPRHVPPHHHVLRVSRQSAPPKSRHSTNYRVNISLTM
jgi:hypothetical protein